jgi:hypothetical protein
MGSDTTSSRTVGHAFLDMVDRQGNAMAPAPRVGCEDSDSFPATGLCC